ncbi:hypothetical protein E2562_009705 [Oryza meyeriana var. granulata]|uniref:Phytocyanin domain-containing protein n=1 Tax=Oryza meyeriana var. granulata TaxID=110450 RepID=A0A6G1D2I9_9ORYZ|nr:hypothetical protein E2562_009705 [Oryza meyeriana var. granulata]
MASSLSIIAMLVFVGCAAVALAIELSFYVGDVQGWRTVFRHARNQHTVTEVTESDYDTCAVSGNPISNFEGSALVTFMPLSPGTHYFICKVGYHCANGMKLAVTVSNSSSGDTPREQPWSPLRFTPTGGASARLHAGGAVVAAAVGVLVKLSLF